MSDNGGKSSGCALVPCLDVDKFARFSSSTFRADKFYKAIGYGLGAAGHLLAHTTQLETETSKGLKALASNIAMARYVIRFTGGFESYEALKNGSWCYGDDDAHLRRVVSLQALSMLAYYPLEHVSYIGFVAPKLLNVDAMKFSRQSCQVWGLYILLDVYANTLRIRTLTAKEKQIKEQKDISDDERRSMVSDVHARRRELYYLQLRNVCYFGACVHWSLEKGCLPEPVVNALCLAEAAIGLWRSWATLK